MSTNRLNSKKRNASNGEKTQAQHRDRMDSGVQKQDANSQSTNSSSVLFKFWVTSFLMFAGPLGVYYTTLKFFTDSTTVAGLLAAVAVNVVLFAYVYMAFQEDSNHAQNLKNR